MEWVSTSPEAARLERALALAGFSLGVTTCRFFPPPFPCYDALLGLCFGLIAADVLQDAADIVAGC